MDELWKVGFWYRYHVHSLADNWYQTVSFNESLLIKNMTHRVGNGKGELLQKPVRDFIRPQ
jgi:hypothetical protein